MDDYIKRTKTTLAEAQGILYDAFPPSPVPTAAPAKKTKFKPNSELRPELSREATPVEFAHFVTALENNFKRDVMDAPAKI